MTLDSADVPPLRPTPPHERSTALDVLRGVAVLGILVMNIRNFGLPLGEFDNPAFPDGDADPLNVGVWAISNVVFEDKMIAIFSMLFGAGLVLMSDRGALSGARRAVLHYRRMFWLFVIGLVHAYGLWYGDILNTYAVCGVVLFPLRRLNATLLIALGVLCLATTIGIRTLPRAFAMVRPPQSAAAPAESLSARIMREASETEQAAYRGGYVDLFRWRARLNTGWHFLAGYRFSFWRSAGYMLIGMGLLRLGLLAGGRSAGVYTGLMIGGYAAGLLFVLMGFAPQLARVLGHAPEYTPEARRAIGLFAWSMRFAGAAGIAIGHVGLVMLICRTVSAGALAPLAAVGRMALTNYLMHTLIAVTIFDGWGFGQWGRWSMAEFAALVAAIWSVQLVLSPLWLARFRFGPVEWVWRSLTYWGPRPMLRGDFTAEHTETAEGKGQTRHRCLG